MYVFHILSDYSAKGEKALILLENSSFASLKLFINGNKGLYITDNL